MNTAYKCKCGNTASPFESCPNCEKPKPMNTKQLTYPSIQEQQQYWIDKEAVSDNATPETREDWQAAIAEAKAIVGLFANGSGSPESKSALRLWHALDGFSEACLSRDISHLSQPASTTADPKPEELSRTESLTDWYDHGRNDFDRGDLQDEGRNHDGSGESYAERNI